MQCIINFLFLPNILLTQVTLEFTKKGNETGSQKGNETGSQKGNETGSQKGNQKP